MIRSMLVSWRIRKLATALPFSSGRSITYYTRRQPSLNLLHPRRPGLRNQPAIGSSLGCCSGHSASVNADNMAENEQQSAQSQEASEPNSYSTEAMGAASGDTEDSKKKELELLKDGGLNEQEGSRSEMAAENLDRADDQGGGDGEGGSDVDPAKTAETASSDHEGRAAVEETNAGNIETVSDDNLKTATATKNEGSLVDQVVNQHQLPEKSSKEVGGDKTPPPEGPEVEEVKVSNPPKQKVGGLGGFFSQFRRGFSLGPRRDRQYYEGLSLEEKRKEYTCGSEFLTLDQIEMWEEFRKKLPATNQKPVRSEYAPNPVLDKKVSLWRGDITRLEIDAIVNAANTSLLGGGGVDGAIHRAGSYSLTDECATLNGCDTGDAKLTSGHRLPAKYVLHTVGPINGSEKMLRSCYKQCLQLVLENDIKSVAFCCIATGVYGYPNKSAAHVALETTRQWLESHADSVDRIIFCVFLKVDYNIYSELLQHYFPPEGTRAGEGEEEEGEGEMHGGGPPPATVTGTEEEKDKLLAKNEVERDVPILKKSITEPGQRVPPESYSYSKPETDKMTESQGPPPPPPSTGALDSREDEAAGGDDTARSSAAAAAVSVEEGREREGGPSTAEGQEGEGVRRDMDNMDDEGSPSSKRSRLDGDEGTGSGEEGEGRVEEEAAAAEMEEEEGGEKMEVDSDDHQHQEGDTRDQ